jgi:phosphoglycolate phosphatase
MNFNNVNTLFFDYDGCIHDSRIIYTPAFKKVYSFLVEKNLAPEKNWREQEITRWIGAVGHDMWDEFMPNLDQQTKRACYKMVGEEMLRLINEGKPKLYDGVKDTLNYLKSRGYTLIFLSNCRQNYKEAHNRFFKLDKYFDDLICSEDFNFIPKHEILKNIKALYRPDMIMIGDRYYDIETGKKNNIYTIGCNYGFAKEGELENADVCINKIADLKKIL